MEYKQILVKRCKQFEVCESVKKEKLTSDTIKKVL